MASTESEAISSLYLRWASESSEAASGLMSPMTLTRYQYSDWGRLTTEPENVTYRTVNVDGLDGLWIQPQTSRPESVILYFHGGAYLGGSISGVRKLAGHLSRAAGVAVLAVEYRLAPEHAFPAQLQDALTSYQWLVNAGYDPKDMVLAGDSAGGLLATVFSLYLRDSERPQVACVTALSPYYDLDAHTETWTTNAESDVVARPEGALSILPLILGDHGRPSDAYVTPLYMDVSGMPPTYIAFGGAESMLGGAFEFAEKARKSGVLVELDVVPGMQHVFQYMAGSAPEATESIARVGEFIRSILSTATPATDAHESGPTVVALMDIRTKPGASRRFRELLSTILAQTVERAGCIGVDIVQDESDEDHIVLVERWQNEEADSAYRAWRRSQPPNETLAENLAAPSRLTKFHLFEHFRATPPNGTTKSGE